MKYSPFNLKNNNMAKYTKNTAEVEELYNFEVIKAYDGIEIGTILNYNSKPTYLDYMIINEYWKKV